MGPVDHLEITGAKGGDSKPKTPVEAPDSLQSTNIAKILLAVGEGEFDGRPTDRDIYLDNTPIMDASGNVNFPGVKWEWRPGSVEQDYIQGIPSVENETNVNVELRSDNPFTRALSNTQLSAVRVRMTWPRLAQQDSNGNTNGYRIEYAIDIATDGGAYVEAHLGAVDGKTTNGYQRSVRVNLPKATSGWMLRVRRITPNANSGTIADTMTIAGYTEIIDQKLRYPNTALLYIEFDAQQFQNIPAVTVKCKAKRWPVPTNYDPVARTYTGVWDGTFKQAWTNNPAFVTYGLCVEDRFGLGKRIKSWMVDKWEMYRIAQYCDQLVPDGVGGQEPRYLCDMNLQGRSEAWTLLRDLAAIYRGMVYWAHGSLFMQADMPRAQDIDYVFTRANVIDGDFVYGGAERNTHYSRALVSYDNPANNYDTDVIPVTDNTLQRRYRDRPVEISAIGCTRASEAQRRGKWALLSNSQDRTVTFKTGMEGRIPLPGYVIPVADELVAGRPNGGRISAAAGRVVTLDRDTPIKAGDRLILNLPNGTAQARTVQSVAGRAVTVTTDYGVQPEPELQWAIDYDDLAVQLFRVLKTTRTQEGEYEITALEFNPSKFAAIDTGAKLDERPISVIPVTTVQPPVSVTLSSTHMIDQGIAVSTMTIAWPAVEGAVAYDVEWRKDNGNWIRLQRTGAASVDVVGIYAGAYLARVRAVSSFDITSIWKSSNLTQLNGKEGLPPAVTFLDTESLLFGIGIKWGFPAGAEDTQRTELWYSEGTDLGLATKLADLAYPQNEHVMQGLRAGQRFFFWARLVDRTGNLGLFFPEAPAVVAGMASADAGAILEQIKDQITESELGQELTSRIDLIDKNGPGSVNDRIGTAKTELAQQISEVNNALNTTKGNLQQQITAVSADVSAAKADLQQQIANVSALAGSLPYRKDKAYSVGQSALGSDGKLYQALKAVPLNTPPPNAIYWTDVGQAVVTANGMAARVQTMETKVETLEGATSAQAQQISGLQSSLTTTNGNVSAAQQAAQDAATLAGGKGKVIVQSAAPAVADRLAQNLWIDTTSNANTPKRWSGTAWVAVTDKVATDAAAAAAGALALVQTKADATVVSSLTTRVSDAEGKLTSQATRMDGMQTSIDGKASSQALQQVTSRVTATEQKDAAQDQQLTSQSQALTSLTDSVSKKADASTVQSLNNRVDQNGTDIAANGQALTSISASLGDLGGENLFYNPSFERPSAADPNLAEGWRIGVSATATWSLVDSTIAPGGKAQRIDASGFIAGSGSTFIDLACRSTSYQPKVSAGQVLTVSADVKGTAGLSVQIFFQFKDSAGVTLATHGPSELVLSGVQQRATLTSKAAPAGSVATEVLLRLRSPAGSSVTAGYVEWDRAQCETGTVASGWRDNGSLQRLDIAANASATSALTGRVAQNEQGLSSQAQKITGLQTSLTTTNQNVATAQQAAAAANTLAGGKGKVIIQAAAPAVDDRLAQNLWIDTTSNANTPKRWSGSSWVAVTDKAATDAAAAAQSALNQVALKADASTVQSLSNAVNQQGSAITANGQAITGIDASLSTVGSDNMLFNPSFDRGTGAVAERWRVGNANSSYSGSLVASTLDPSGKAQRFDVTGLVPGSGSSFVDLAPSIGDQPPVSAGQIYAASIYVRGAQGLQAQVFVQFKGASGNTLATTGPTDLMLADAWQRVAVSPATAPVGAVSVDILYRVRAPAGSSVSAGFVEWDRAQFENGDRATGWRDNGLIAAADIATNASATTALTSRVAVAESGLTSASTQLTQLKNSIGDVGGENLLYNPSFERPLATDANIADGWVARGPASAALSLVDSTLEPGAKAQRLDVSGLVAGSGSAYIDFALRSATQPKLSPGQISTVSTHVRGTPGLALQMFFQFKNAAFATIGTHGPINVVLGAAWKRASYTSQAAPADTVTTDILLRVRSDDGSNVTAGWVEFDRAQLELGASMSGWRDNGRVAAAAASSLSSAVDGLTSSVSQQGANLSSVAGRTTSLENNLATTNGNVTSAQQAAQAAATAAGAKGEVIYGATAPTADKRLTQNLWIDTTGNANTPKRWNGTTWVAVSDKVATDAATAAQSALSQVATKAEASALQSLTNRVSAAEGVNTSQSASLVDLTSSVGTIQSGLGASGLDPAPSGLWQFDTDVEGWTASGATITVATAGAMRVTATNNDPQLIRGGLSLAGSVFSVVRARITRRAGAASDWDGKLFYSTASHGWGNYYKQAVNPSLAVGQTAVVEWDMAALTAGGTDWVSSVINQLRLDLSNTSGGAFDVDWIAVGRVAPGASSRALESVTSTVTQQGATLNAESQRIEGLMTSVGAANAAIQNEATARSDADTALSQQIQTTQSSLGATNASVQQISTAQTGLNNRVNAQFSIKVAVTQAGVYALGGIGVGIRNQDGVLQSVVAVLADQFAVINAAGNGYVSPFAIQGGQVFMNDAFIRDGSIINAKIANGAITSAKIGVAEIDTLRIRGNAVTVPVSANSPGNVLGAGVGQWQNLVAVGVQMDEGGFITAQYSCYQGFGSGIRKYQFQMDINGLVIAEGGGDWADGFPNLMGSIGVGPGFFVVTVKWWGENTGVGVRNHNLFAMGTKR